MISVFHSNNDLLQNLATEALDHPAFVNHQTQINLRSQCRINQSIVVVRGNPVGLALLVAADVLLFLFVAVVVDERVVVLVVVAAVAAVLLPFLFFAIFCSRLSRSEPCFQSALI